MPQKTKKETTKMTDYIVNSRGVVIPYGQWLVGYDSPYGIDLQDGIYADRQSSLEAALEAMYLKEELESNLTKIRLGRLAKANGQCEGVRALGEKLVQNHSALNVTVQILALSREIVIPLEVKSAAAQAYNQLAKLIDTELFDEKFLKIVIADHTRAIERLHKWSSGAYKDLVSESITVLLRQLAVARFLAEDQGRDATPNRMH